MLKRGMIAVALAGIAAGAAYSAIDGEAKPYATSLVSQYETSVVMSVGDTVPMTGAAGKEFQMVGIPDGMGIRAHKDGGSTLWLNQEMSSSKESEPVLGDPRYRGAFVSLYEMEKDGTVVSGKPAYDTVYVNDEKVGPPAMVGNDTRAFSRFCSAMLAGRAEGLDRDIFFTNEEDGNPETSFDGKGSLTVAIFDGQAHGLPALGHLPAENSVVQSNRHGNRTVILLTEDGPATTDPAVENSQLYMYVGTKQRRKGATVLERNGLVGGTLYVFKAKHGATVKEFQSGSIEGEWVAIDGAADMDQAQLEAASDAVGLMPLARPEDGAFNPHNSRQFFFNTTGGDDEANALGRTHTLDLGLNPLSDPVLTVVTNADADTARGVDGPMSQDNIGVSNEYVMLQEDGTSQSRKVMGERGRDGSIWRFNLMKGGTGIDAASRVRVAELDPPGRDGAEVGPGEWESSGIIATDASFGKGSWLFNVQAHSPTVAPGVNTVEDGQLLILKPVAS